MYAAPCPHQRTARGQLGHFQLCVAEVIDSFTASTIFPAEIPCCSSSCSVVPLRGRTLTHNDRIGIGMSDKAPLTASPIPPAAKWSSTVTYKLVSSAAVRNVSTSSGFTE